MVVDHLNCTVRRLLTAEELLQRLVLSQHPEGQPARRVLHAAQQEALQPGRKELRTHDHLHTDKCQITEYLSFETSH